MHAEANTSEGNQRTKLNSLTQAFITFLDN